MDIAGKARKIERKLARTVDAAIGELVGRDEAAPLEIVHAVLDRAEHEVQDIGRGRRVFPFNCVRILVLSAAQDTAAKARFEAVYDGRRLCTGARGGLGRPALSRHVRSSCRGASRAAGIAGAGRTGGNPPPEADGGQGKRRSAGVRVHRRAHRHRPPRRGDRSQAAADPHEPGGVFRRGTRRESYRVAAPRAHRVHRARSVLPNL